MSRKLTRREMITISAVGVAAAGTAAVFGRIIRPPDMGLPDPYPEPLGDKVKIASAGRALFLDEGQYAVVAALASIIVPSDGTPGAAEAGAADYIDRLIARSVRKQEIYTGGLQWLERFSRRKYGKHFTDLGAADQIGILKFIDNSIAMRVRHAGTFLARLDRKIDTLWDDRFGAGDGIRFFRTLRRDVFCACYSNPVCWKEVGYYGPPVPLGYRDYADPPLDGQRIGAVRRSDAGSCRNCHSTVTHQPAVRKSTSCTDCHPSHFALKEGTRNGTK